MHTFLSGAYPVSNQQFEKLNQLFELFQAENQKINLSAIREEKAVWEKHFYDSLLAAEFLQNANKIIDLGSGGGFPLLVLAIIFPEKTFFGTESVGKKVQAMEKFSKELGLKNVQILNQRIEEIGQKPKYREQFDAIIARAFAPHPVLLEMALPLLKINGEIISFRGPNFDEEDKLLPAPMGAKIEKIVHKKLPAGDERSFWIIKKTKKTSKHFPRAVGIPNKKPLSLTLLQSLQNGV